MSRPSPVHLDVSGEILVLSLRRPDELNALDLESIAAVADAIDRAGATRHARVLLLRGEGRAFCGGGDVAEMFRHRDALAPYIARMIDRFHEAVMALNRLPMPVIASVHGAVAGGGMSLALACDLVLAARGTRFVTAYAQLGTSSDGGLSYRLVQKLGGLRAFELLALRGTLDASEALRLGLINELVEADRADEAALAWARQLAGAAPQSIIELKGLVAQQSRDALQQHLAREKDAFLRCAATPEFAARVAAFATKRRDAREPSHGGNRA